MEEDILSRYQENYAQYRTLSPEAFARGLVKCPDREFVDNIVHDCTFGVRIGYKGPREARSCVNWPSVAKLESHVQASIEKDVALGRKLGPFSCPPCATYMASPLGAFEKRSSAKVRVVHDLSYPRGNSINDFIDPEDYQMKYMSIDDVVKEVKKLGCHALMAKADLSDAYHHILVHKDDWPLLGSVFIDEDGNIWYYVSTVLPFGLRSAPKRFSGFALAAKLIMLYAGATYIDQYLDDFITVGHPGTEECQHNLHVMLSTFSDVNFTVNPQKVSSPTTVLEFLGIVIDSDLMQLRISKDRLEAVIAELSKWIGRTHAQKREILSLVGKLTFVSRVVRSGRTFVRRMIDTAKKVKLLHHKIYLSKDFKADVEWWLMYLPTWNGISVFYEDEWVSSDAMDLFTDASDQAVSGYFNRSWFVLPVSTQHSINWRELYAIVVAAATFGMHWQGKRINFHCDNMSVVYVLSSGTSRNPDLMCLVRELFFVAAMYQFEFRATYINTKVNLIADSLSRYNWRLFHEVAPDANPCMTQPVL